MPNDRAWRLVVLESPFKGNTQANLAYARQCIRDCLLRGEAPFASHVLYPGALDDGAERERQMGMAAGLAWGDLADATVVYTDMGISSGMLVGIGDAHAANRPVEYRSLIGG